MKVEEKRKAIALRKTGMSMNEIVRILGVSKASVSLWTRKVELTSEQRNKLSLACRSVDSIEKRRINRLANELAKRSLIMVEAEKDFQSISDNDLKIIGAMLYWGEGGKTQRGTARISNSDPAVIKVAMLFFRKVCLANEEKFRAHIHTYSHLNAEEAEKYWSGITGIPRSQFYKTYIKRSITSQGKRDKLPYGTIDVQVNDTKLFLTIMGWIEKIKALLVS